MPTPPLSREKAVEAVNAVTLGRRDKLSIRAIAARNGMSAGTLEGRIVAARRLYGLVPEEPPEPIIEVVEAPAERQRVRVKAWRQPDDLPTYRVLGIGDLHDNPDLPKDRLRWIGRHAAATRPDEAVFIGDIFDVDSLSRHAAPGSQEDKLRPSFARDLESLEEALSLFRKEWQGRATVTLGNHEGRIFRYEQANPGAAGMLSGPFNDVLARFDMRPIPEGEYYMVGGVAFVHCPRSLMDREMGGEWLNSVANRSVVSTVFGHSHRGQVLHAHKCGPWGGITLVNLGTALPMGYIKKYAQRSSSSWTWGLYDLTIQAGKIIGHSFHSMDDLQRKYG